jgi:hypothetical protein
VVAGFIARVTVFVTVVRVSIDRLTGLGLPVASLSNPAHLPLVVLELGEIDDLDRDPDPRGVRSREIAVTDELREVLSLLFTDLPKPFNIVSESHLLPPFCD